MTPPGEIVGLGVDVEQVGRVRRACRRHGGRFLRRVFTEAEREYCLAKPDPYPHLAARFAAKEAAFKALGTGWGRGVGWHDVEVCHEKGGAPRLVFSGSVAAHTRALVSLSHTSEYAVATVIILGFGGREQRP